MEVEHLLLHQLHQQLMQQLPGYIPYCLSSHIMEPGHLQSHRQDVKMRRQEVYAISCLTAPHLRMRRLLSQELTSFSGCDKITWLSQASVATTSLSAYHKFQRLSQTSMADTINAPLNWAVCICHCLPMAESMAYKSLTILCCLPCR